MNKKKDEYEKMYQDAIDKYLQRPAFEFDVNADEMYNKYAKLYADESALASEDAMGRATSLTGGYGNSYAQTVGAQTYADTMRGLDTKLSESYQRALNEYNQEGSDMLGKISLLSGIVGQTDDNASNVPENIPEYVITNLGNYDSEEGQADYLAALVNKDVIDEDVASELLKMYGTTGLKDRTWEMVTDGGLKMGSLDRNAKIKDEYGNEYRIGELYRQLKKTMSAKEARAYIEKLQAGLGI